MTAKEHAKKQPESSTPGRPHGTSRQQKHEGQNLNSGSDSLDRRAKDHRSGKAPPTPPGPK
jgi:hypothetical protein